MKRLLTFIHAALWILFSWILIKYLAHQIHDPDTWWHLANGRAMWKSGHILRKDIFSHTLTGMPWINFEWLSQIVMAGLEKLGGLNAIYLAKIFLGALVVVLLVVLGWAAGGRGLPLLLLTLLGYRMLLVRLCTRVELATFVLLPLISLLLLHAGSWEQRHRRWLPWITLVLFTFWSNMHAGFIYGLALVGLFCVGSRWAKLDRAHISTVDRSFVFALIGILLNPWGPRLIQMFVEVLVDFGSGPNLLNEWKEASGHQTGAFWAALALCALVLLGGLVQRKTWARFWAPAVVVFGILSAQYFRSTALFSFVAIPFLAHAFSSEIRIVRFLNRTGTRVGMAVIALGILALDFPLFTQKIPANIIDVHRYPIGAVEFIRRENIRGRMYNSWEFGGYLAWSLGPERPVFMDSRYLFYPLLTELEDLRNGRSLPIRPESWQLSFDRWGVDHAVVRYDPLRMMKAPGEKFHRSITNLMFPSDHWALVYWDETSLVFLKRIAAHSDVIRRFEYRHLRPYNLEETHVRLVSGISSLDQAQTEMDRNRAEVGDNPLNHLIQTGLIQIRGLLPTGKKH